MPEPIQINQEKLPAPKFETPLQNQDVSTNNQNEKTESENKPFWLMSLDDIKKRLEGLKANRAELINQKNSAQSDEEKTSIYRQLDNINKEIARLEKQSQFSPLEKAQADIKALQKERDKTVKSITQARKRNDMESELAAYQKLEQLDEQIKDKENLVTELKANKKNAALEKANKKLAKLQRQKQELLIIKKDAEESKDQKVLDTTIKKLNKNREEISALQEKIKRLGGTLPKEKSQPAKSAQIQNQPIKEIKASEQTPVPVQKENQQPAKNENKPVEQSQPETPAPKHIKGVEGNTTKVKADNGKEYEVRYKVVDVDDLNASHMLESDGVYKNNNYPDELQPRDRDRIAMQAGLISMGNNLSPEDLMNSRNLNQGAPITRDDGVVLNGNGRTAAIKYAYKNGKAGKYRNTVIENAEKFGIDRDAVEKMRYPVLVRELTGEISDEDLKAITESQTGGARIGGAEQAKIDAKKITVKSLEKYVDNERGDLNTAANRDFLIAVLKEIVPANELNAYTTADGSVNADGIRRVKNALFALAYNDDGLIEKIAESTNDDIKRITNALMSAAPKIAQIQIKMDKGLLNNYDLSVIARATAKFDEITHNPNMKVGDYLQQQNLPGFADDETDEKRELVKFIDQHKNSAIYISDFLKGVAQTIEVQGNPNQINLFEEDTKANVPLMTVIKRAEDIAEKKFQERSEKNRSKRISLFGDNGNVIETPAPVQTSSKENQQLAKTQSPKSENDSETMETFLGNEDETRQEMLESLKKIGIEIPAKKFSSNKTDKPKDSKKSSFDEDDQVKIVEFIDTSDEALNAELELIANETKKLSANPVFNPTIWKAGFKIGAIYAQRGINRFANWENQMTQSIGDAIKPYINSIWEALKNVPQGSKFNDEQVAMIGRYAGVLMLKDEVKSYEDLKSHFEEMLGKENLTAIEPMLKPAYASIKKFLDENVNNQQAESLVKSESESVENNSAQNEKASVKAPDNKTDESQSANDGKKKTPAVPITLPNGKTIYETYNQDKDFLNEPIGKSKAPRWQIIEGKVLGDQPRESLKKEAEKKYYDYVKKTLGKVDENIKIPNDYKFDEDIIVKNDNGKDEYTARIKGNFETDKGKQVLQDLTKLAEKFGGTLKYNSADKADFYFGEKPVNMNAFKDSVKLHRTPAKGDSKNDDPRFEIGEFINPKYGREQFGVRFKQRFDRKEYEELVEIAEEHGGWDYENGNMFLFANKEDRDAFVADANKEYLKTPEIAPLAACRTWKDLRLTLDEKYGGILIPLYCPMHWSVVEAKKLAIEAVNLGIENGLIKYSNGNFVISDESYGILQEYFNESFGENLFNKSAHKRVTPSNSVESESPKDKSNQNESVVKAPDNKTSEIQSADENQEENIKTKLYQIVKPKFPFLSNYIDGKIAKNYIKDVSEYVKMSDEELAEESFNTVRANIQIGQWGKRKKPSNSLSVTEKRRIEFCEKFYDLDDKVSEGEISALEGLNRLMDEIDKLNDADMIISVASTGIYDITFQDGERAYDKFIATQKNPEKTDAFMTKQLKERKRYRLVERVVIGEESEDSLKTNKEREYLAYLRKNAKEIAGINKGVIHYKVDPSANNKKLNKNNNSALKNKNNNSALKNQEAISLNIDQRLEEQRKKFNGVVKFHENFFQNEISKDEYVGDISHGERVLATAPSTTKFKVLYPDRPTGYSGTKYFEIRRYKRTRILIEYDDSNQTSGKAAKIHEEYFSDALHMELYANGAIEIEVTFPKNPFKNTTSTDTTSQPTKESGIETEIAQFLSKPYVQENLSKTKDYNGVVETRREHIERLAKEHPDYTASSIIISRSGTKDIYGNKTTSSDEHKALIYHLEKSEFEKYRQENKKFPPYELAEFVTFAELNYFRLLVKSNEKNLATQTNQNQLTESESESVKNKSAQNEKSVAEVQSADEGKENSDAIKTSNDNNETATTEQRKTDIKPFDEENQQETENSTENIALENQTAAENLQGDKTSTATDEIETRAREALKAAGLEGKFSNDKNFKAEIYARNNATVLLKKSNESDSMSDDSERDIQSLKELFNVKDKFQIGGIHSSYRFQNENDALIFKTALDIYFGNEGVLENESGKLGESGSVDDGHRNVESKLRETADEETRQEGSDKISEDVSGQQRQDESESAENVNGTNAENARPVSVPSTGTSSPRVGDRNGTGGSTAVVQSDDGSTERGRTGVSENVENVEEKPNEYSGHNFHITDDSGIGKGNAKEKFKQNIDAIKLLKQLENEGRMATPSEQEILSKFNGWGTLASAFTKKDEWQKQAEQLKEILTDEEYKSAISVTTNAFYTPTKIANVMWQMLGKLGFKGGRVLDPATGSGIFFGTMPNEVAARSELTGVEYESLAGRIAQQLYQKAAIDIMPFQKRSMPNNFYDLIITNVPFEETRIYSDKNYSKQGYMLHNYYFAKALDKVRPGGLVAFITSQGTMRSQDAQAKQLRAELNGKADLIAAFKLPNNAFKENAGTQVTTDILILQKRLDPTKPSEYAQKWNTIDEIRVENEKSWQGHSYLPINEYFNLHPENMIGTPIVDTLWAGGNRLALDGKGLDVAEELSKLIENLPENIYTPIQNNTQDTLKNTFAAMENSNQLGGSFVLQDNKVLQIADGNLVAVPAKITVNRNKKQVEIDNPALPVIKDFVTLRNSLNNLLKAQLSPETTAAKLSDLRESLNKNYDNFVQKHGYINAPKNLKFLGEDPSYGKVAAIEKYTENKETKTVSASKDDIFYKRTATPLQVVNSTDNALDALRLSLSRRGTVDTDYMSQLTGKNLEELSKELGDLVYKNPKTNLIELADEYLSGNVREKLQFAREAAKHNPEFNRNVEALEKVLPVDLTANQIFPHIGANWINEKYYLDFINHLIGDSKNVQITRDPFTGKWKVSGWIPYDKNVAWRVMHGADTKADFVKLFEGALNHHYPNMTSNKVQLKEQTAEAREKIDKITEEFDKWIYADEERKADLVKTYNEKFNSEVERRYDGSHLELPDLNDEIRKKLYPHQKDAIYRILQGKNTLLAHAVGAGKTFEMIISAMEMKRIGMINKPIFVVPNNIVKQIEDDFRAAYPNANLLVLSSAQLAGLKTKSSKKNETEAEKNLRLATRRKTLSQIATNNWDGIIISHNLFERLPMSLEGIKQFSRDGEKIARAGQVRATADSPADVKYATQIINAATERIEEEFNLDTKEMIMPFEELGIDQIFVDESDLFKNLGFETSNYNPSDPNPDNRVIGVSTANSNRANDLYTKVRWLSAQRNGGGLVFASGTPISNTLNEIYTNMRYLIPEFLEENGWKDFDSWANHFGKTVATVEANAAGEYVQKRRLNLNNLPALIKGFRKTADIKMIEDLPHLQENRPKLKNGKRTIISIKPTAAFNEIKKWLLDRNEALHKAKSKAERNELNDNYLKIVGDFRKASLDIRLIDPLYSEEESGGKINAVCDSVFAKFNETTDVKGSQLVFLDLSTPKAAKQNAQGEDITDEETSTDEVTVYDRIKKGLIQRGIPANQIAFVHEAKDAEARKALFKKVNEGEIRVIIGSTAKMGAGTNFQKHLVALHHVDCPWRPRDIEQREGRILRNGNLNKEVEIFTYVTKGSYDAINWDLVSKKQAMIDSLMRGDPTITEIEDISDIAADYKSIAATGDDNPLQKEMRELEEKILRLKSSQRMFIKNQKIAQSRAAILQQKEIPAVERRIQNLKADTQNLENLVGDNFSMKIGDNVYTKFGDAKAAFETVLKDFKNLSSTKIGEIGGFDIKARSEFTQADRGGILEIIGKHVYLTLEKNGSYGVDTSLEAIRNFISGNKGTSIVKLLDKENARLDKLNDELKGLSEQIKQTFDKQAELDEAEKRLNDITRRIQGNSDNELTQSNEVSENENDETKTSESLENNNDEVATNGLSSKQPNINSDAKKQINEQTDKENEFENWTDDDIFNAGKNGKILDTADGIIRITRATSKARGYTISYEPATELSVSDKKSLGEAIEERAYIYDIHQLGDLIGESQKENPLTFRSNSYNYGYNYTPEKARELGLEDTKKFVKDLRNRINSGDLFDKLRTGEKKSQRGNGNAQITNATPVKAPPSMDECKNFEDVKNYWAEKYDVKVDDSVGKIKNFEPVKDFLTGVESVIKHFPFITKSVPYIVAKKMRNTNDVITTAALRYFEKEKGCSFIVNTNVFDDTKFIEKTNKDFENDKAGRSKINYTVVPKNSNSKVSHMEIVGAHETGHLIESYLHSKVGQVPFGFFKPLLRLFIQWVHPSYNKTIKGTKSLGYDISEYAGTNERELLAEAVADYITNGEDAAEFSKALWKKLNAALTTEEWTNFVFDGTRTELFGSLSAEAALKWAESQIKNGNKYNVDNHISKIVHDKNLATLLGTPNLTVDEKLNLLRDHIPNEEILGSTKAWTDEKINEIAKDEIYANAIQQLGAKIVDGKVTYPDEQTRRFVLKFLKSSSTPSARFSIDLSETDSDVIEIGNFVNPQDLTAQQELLTKIAHQIGAPIVFFSDDNTGFHGAYQDGIICLNTNSSRSITQTFAHELFHFLKANNPTLFSAMAKAAGITEDQLADYLNRTKRIDVEANDDVTEEMIADAMQEILNRVAKKDTSLVQRFFAWLQDMFSKVKDFFVNPKGKLTRGQYAKMADTFGKMATKLKDSDGNNIFRYNNRTHNLELANGESLNGLLDNTETDYEGSDNQGFFDLNGFSLAGSKFSRTNDNTAGTQTNTGRFSLPEGYRTESGRTLRNSNSDEFIVDANGNRNLWHIPESVEQNSNGKIKALPVRLQVGRHFDSSNTGSGFLHLARKHLRAIREHGFENAFDFVDYVIKNFDKGYEHPRMDNRVILFCDDNSRGFMPIEMVREGNYYKIITAYPNTNRNLNRELIYNESTTSSAATTNDTTGTVTNSNITVRGINNNGGVNSLGANVEINSPSENISQSDNEGNGENSVELTNARFSIGSDDSNVGSSDNSISKWFSGIADKFSRALGLKGDRIVTEEIAEKRLQAEQKKAMDAYIKDRSKENKQRLKELKISQAMLTAYENGEEFINQVGLKDVTIASPSRVAEKIAAFRAYFRMGDKAMDKLVRLRDQFSSKLNAANDLLKGNDDNETLTNLLLDGDANEVEYGELTDKEKNSIIANSTPETVTKKLQQARIQKICDETGVSENVAQAYVKIRQLMTKAYHALNDAKRRPKIESKYLSNDEINELKNNKFVTIMKISNTTNEDGEHLTTYKKYHYTEKTYDGITKDVLDRFEKDPAMQVLKATVKGIADGEKIYHVKVREGIAAVTNRRGYVPHLFHEYMIRVKDKDGKIVERFGYGGVIGSGRNQREAIKIAEEWKKNNPNGLRDGEEIYISPKVFNATEHLGMTEEEAKEFEKKYAPVMGDKDFDVMVHNIAKYNDMKIVDAKKLVDGSVKMKNRHRFFGNFMQRKGAQGYSQDMQWVLRHYLNSVARYVALETEFKPQAISLFERHFGSFEKDWENNSLAKFTKQFINDVNGNPSTLETILNKALNSSSIYRNTFTANFGERAALSATNALVGRISYLKLGVLNLSSALLNLTQLTNAAGYLGGINGWKNLLKHFGSVASRRGKLTLKELRILTESGVLSDIGLDTATGYDKNRGQFGTANSALGKALRFADIGGNKSMIFFQTMDTMCRISTTLAAYEQAINEGKSRNEALNFARDVNRKANFSYGVEDAPNIFRRTGVIGKIILQFQKYPLKELEVIADMLPTSKKTNFSQKAAFWLPYLLTCGLMGLPFLDWLDKMFGENLGLFPKDFLQKVAIKGSQEIFGDNEIGKTAGKIAMYGAPAILNIDMSQRAGLSGIMPRDLQSFLLGATGSTIFGVGSNVADGVINDTDGAYLNALRSVSPGAYNIFAAILGETKGTRGRTTSVYEDVYDRLIRGMGFKSVDESLATDIQRITYNDRDALTKEKQRAVDDFLKDPSSENAKRLKELGVKPDTVKKERERKQLDRLGRVQAGMTQSELERNKYLLDFAK